MDHVEVLVGEHPAQFRVQPVPTSEQNWKDRAMANANEIMTTNVTATWPGRWAMFLLARGLSAMPVAALTRKRSSAAQSRVPPGRLCRMLSGRISERLPTRLG